MDRSAVYGSMAIYRGHEKAYVDSHTHICNTYTHLVTARYYQEYGARTRTKRKNSLKG